MCSPEVQYHQSTPRTFALPTFVGPPKMLHDKSTILIPAIGLGQYSRKDGRRKVVKFD